MVEMDLAIILLRQVAFANGSKQQGLVSFEHLAGKMMGWD